MFKNSFFAAVLGVSVLSIQAQAVTISVASETKNAQNCLMISATEDGKALGLELESYTLQKARGFRYDDEDTMFITNGSLQITVKRSGNPEAKAVQCLDPKALLGFPTVEVNGKEQGFVIALPNQEFKYFPNTELVLP